MDPPVSVGPPQLGRASPSSGNPWGQSPPQDAHRQATYTITGPRPITHSEMAGAVAEATGQPVRFLDTAPDEFAAALHHSPLGARAPPLP